MKRRKCAVEDARRPRAIKVNGGAPAREVRDPIDCSAREGSRDLRRQLLRRDSAVDHDGVDADTLGRHRGGETTGTVLAREIEYFITSAISATDEVRQRLLIAIGGSDFTET